MGKREPLIDRVIRVTDKLAQVNILELTLFANLLQLNVLDELEKFLIRGVARVRPAAFNIVKSKVVQNSSNLDFIS